MSRMSFVFLVLLTLGVFSSSASAQTQFGSVTGQVLDPNGAIVVDAKVTLTNVTTGEKREVTTNESGVYTIANAPAAKYELTVEKSGFRGVKQPVTVQVAQTVTANFSLEIGEISNVVTVSEAPVVVNTTSGELSRTVTAQEISNLPLLTRNPYALVGLAPGASDTGQVTGDTRGLGVAVNGARTSSINFMLDGGENNDTFVAGVGQTVPLDAIQEFKVQTNNMTAEFGRNAVVTNVITKSGTNEFHGSLYEFYRGAGLTSNTFEDNANGTPKSNFVRNNFGGTFGGRIVKDKTFFFGSLEGLRVRSRGTARFLVPTANFVNAASTNTKNFLGAFGGLPTANDPGVSLTAEQIVVGIEGAETYAGNELRNANTGAIIPGNTVLFQRTIVSAPIDNGGGAPQNTWRWTGRIDHHFNDNTSLFGRYAYDNSSFFNGTVSLSPYEGFNTGQRTRNQNLNLTLTRILSATLSSESRLVYNRIFANQPLGEAPATTPCWQYDLFNATPTGDIITFPGYVPNVCSFAGIPFGGPQNIYQGFEGITWSHNKHTVKAGGQYLHMRDNRTFGAFENGYFDTFSMQGMLDGGVNFISVAIDPHGKVPGDTYDTATDGPFGFPSFTRHYRYNEWAFYGEDSIKATRKLTLNLGLRWEYFGVHHSAEAEKLLDANFFLGSVGGVSNSLFEQIRDGRFRRTNGLFYRQDWNNFAPRFGFAYDLNGDARTVIRGGYGLFYDRNFGNATFNAIQNPPNYAVVNLIFEEGLPVLPNQFNTLNGAGAALVLSSSARMLDENLKTAYSAQWNATVEHDLFGKGIILSGSYVGSRGYHLYSLNNINQRGSCLLLPGSPCNLAGNIGSRLNQTGVTGLNRRGNEGQSNYKGFSFEANARRLGDTGLSVNGNYTWSHSRDNESSFFADSPFEAAFGFGFTDPFNPARDMSDSTNDIRHRVTTSGIWDLPFARNLSGLNGRILGGWSLNWIFVAQTGGAFTVYDGSTATPCALSGTNFCLPVQLTSVPAATAVATGNPNRFALYNPGSALQTQTAFCGGDLLCAARLANGLAGSEKLEARNQFRTPGFWNADFSVLKNFALREGMVLQLRSEFFNIFNHSNLYVIPGTNVVTGAASQVIAARGLTPVGTKERRNVQLAIRLSW